jgi:catechol-2,3-dioxygenase
MARTDTSLLTGVSHVVLRVSDLDASAAWYRDVLGLEEFRREPTGRFVGMRAASGLQVGLFAGGPSGSSGALDHLAFTVADLETLTAWADHLLAVGIAHEGVEPSSFGHSLDLFDPDGNNIELVSGA